MTYSFEHHIPVMVTYEAEVLPEGLSIYVEPVTYSDALVVLSEPDRIEIRRAAVNHYDTMMKNRGKEMP